MVLVDKMTHIFQKFFNKGFPVFNTLRNVVNNFNYLKKCNNAPYK